MPGRHLPNHRSGTGRATLNAYRRFVRAHLSRNPLANFCTHVPCFMTNGTTERGLPFCPPFTVFGHMRPIYSENAAKPFESNDVIMSCSKIILKRPKTVNVGSHHGHTLPIAADTSRRSRALRHLAIRRRSLTESTRPSQDLCPRGRAAPL